MQLIKPCSTVSTRNLHFAVHRISLGMYKHFDRPTKSRERFQLEHSSTRSKKRVVAFVKTLWITKLWSFSVKYFTCLNRLFCPRPSLSWIAVARQVPPTFALDQSTTITLCSILYSVRLIVDIITAKLLFNFCAYSSGPALTCHLHFF